MANFLWDLKMGEIGLVTQSPCVHSGKLVQRLGRRRSDGMAIPCHFVVEGEDRDVQYLTRVERFPRGEKKAT